MQATCFLLAINYAASFASGYAIGRYVRAGIAPTGAASRKQFLVLPEHECRAWEANASTMSRISVPVRRRDPQAPQTELLLRLRFDGVKPLLGPVKVELLEQIDSGGSISAASRAMHMSYHRAWTIVNEINAMFREPLVQTQLGGTAGGGAMITPLGRDVVRRYRSIESSVWKHAAEHIAAL